MHLPPLAEFFLERVFPFICSPEYDAPIFFTTDEFVADQCMRDNQSNRFSHGSVTQRVGLWYIRACTLFVISPHFVSLPSHAFEIYRARNLFWPSPSSPYFLFYLSFLSVYLSPPRGPQSQLYAQFFSLTMLEEGKTLQDFHQRVERDCLPTFMRGLCYWPLVGVVNFKFVPVVNRPGVSSIAGLFWSIYLSHRANSEMEDDDMVEVVETLGRATVVRPLEESARPSSAAAAAIAPAMAAEPLSPADVGNEPSPSSSDIAVLAGGLAGGSVAGSDARRGKEARAAGVVGGVTATDRRGVVDVRGANGVVGAVATAEAEAAAKAGEAGETTPGRTRRKRKVVRRTTVVSY